MTFRNPDDWPIDEYEVKEVRVEESGFVSVTSTDGWTFGITAEEAQGKPVPEVGEEIVLLGGFGRQIRGIFIGGREYRYVSKVVAEAELVASLADYERRKKEAYDAHIEDWVARKNALDEPFRQRLERFEEQYGSEDFWREDGGYELFTVEQANKLYGVAMTKDKPVRAIWLDEFYEATWEEQKAMFPELDEGHSGNTFGGMVGLARAVAEGREI